MEFMMYCTDLQPWEQSDPIGQVGGRLFEDCSPWLYVQDRTNNPVRKFEFPAA